MFHILLLTVWRFLIFLLGVGTLGLIVALFWPESPGRFSIFILLLLSYCLMAYFVIPMLFRLYHVFIKHDHIPLYVTTRDGWASDPVNLAMIVTDVTHLQKAMKKAGWYEADPPTIRNSLNELRSIAFNTPYPSAPVSTLYLFNRKHDIAFQIPTNDKMSARTRHHIRFWRLEAPEPEKHDHNHFEFWSQKLYKWLHHDKEIWIGACTEDTRPIGLRWRTGSITHGVSHESDKERDFIIQTLKDCKLVKDSHVSEPGEQLRFRGQQFRTFYISDGSIKIAHLRAVV